MTLNLANILTAFLAVALIRAGMFGYWLHRTRTLQGEYKQYLKQMTSEDKEERIKGFGLVERLPEIRELFRRAQIKDYHRTRMEPVGFNRVQQQNYTGFDNITVADRGIAAWVIESFHEAAGHYKKGIWEAFNPVFWIEFAGRAPGTLAVQLGVSESSRWVKFTNAGVWLPIALFLGFSLATGDPIHFSWKGKLGEIEIQSALPEPAAEDKNKE